MTNEQIVEILEAFKNYYESRKKCPPPESRYVCDGKVTAYLDAIQLLTDSNYARQMYADWVKKGEN